MKLFKLFAFILLSILFYQSGKAQIKNQVINNISDPVGVTLFVKAGSTQIGNGYNFREATASFNMSQGQNLTVEDNYFNQLAYIPMYPSTTGFIWLFNGVENPSQFYNPYNRDLNVQLLNQNVMDMSFSPGSVGILFVNGVTDAPKLRLKDKSSGFVWADTVDYNRWSNTYLYQPPANYTIEVRDAKKDTVINTYKVDLSTYGNKPMVFFTSGFMFPEKNKNGGADFGLFAVGLDGKVIQFPTTTPSLGTTILSSPVDSATDQPISGTLTWKLLTGATSYHLQLSKDNNFGTTIIDQTNLTNLSLPYNTLEYGTRYFWRVQAKSSTLTGKWSAIWSFTTLGVLSPPLLQYPGNDTTGVPLSFDLMWSAIQGAKSYHIQVSKSGDFNLNTLDSSLIYNSLLVDNLEYLTKYYWRVATVNDAGQGNWSTIWDFTTMKEPKIPAQTSLVYPSENATATPVRDSLVWLPVDGATEYHVEFSTNKKGSMTNDSILFDDTTIDTVITDFATLDYQTKYWWRVQAKNFMGYGNWSPLWQFETEKYVSVKNTVPYINNFKIVPNPVSELLITNYELRMGGTVRISLINQLGQEVAVIKDEYEDAGIHNCQFSIPNLSPGLYFVQMTTDNETWIRKVLVVK